jgi:hypothetical protein
MFASFGKSLCSFMNNQPTSRPIPPPPITIHKKLSVASSQMNWPVATANMANRKMIREDASLSKLSPSRIDVTRLGTFTNLRMALALTASGGDTIPPSKNPMANDIPGKNKFAAMATEQAVKNTTMNAKLEIILLHFQRPVYPV